MSEGREAFFMPQRLTAVQMEAESGCSRCVRQILLMEKAFLDESYAAICVNCVESAFNLRATAPHLFCPLPHTHQRGEEGYPDE